MSRIRPIIRSIGRDYEWELMPLALDQGVGAVVWSPLGWGRLTGKIRRGQPLPKVSRLHETAAERPAGGRRVSLQGRGRARTRSRAKPARRVPQVALNWLLQRPSVSTVIIGARDEKQLKDNLGAVGWNLTAEQVAKLDAASAVTPAYPYWHQRSSSSATRSRSRGGGEDFGEPAGLAHYSGTPAFRMPSRIGSSWARYVGSSHLSAKLARKREIEKDGLSARPALIAERASSSRPSCAKVALIAKY